MPSDPTAGYFRPGTNPHDVKPGPAPISEEALGAYFRPGAIANLRLAHRSKAKKGKAKKAPKPQTLHGKRIAAGMHDPWGGRFR